MPGLLPGGAYVSLLAPGKTDYTACHPRKTTTYIYYTQYLSLRIRTTDASQLEKRNKEQIRRERKGKKREESEKKNEKGKKNQVPAIDTDVLKILNTWYKILLCCAVPGIIRVHTLHEHWVY